MYYPTDRWFAATVLLNAVLVKNTMPLLNTLLLLTTLLLVTGCGGSQHPGNNPAAAGFSSGTATGDEVSATADGEAFTRAATEAPIASSSPSLAVQFAASLPSAPRQRILGHLQALGWQIETLADDAATLPVTPAVWLIGQTPLTDALFGPLPDDLPAEGFDIATRHHDQQTIYSSRGRDGGATDLTPNGPAIGDLYGAYALLEIFGMRFLHPLEPTTGVALQGWPDINHRESPHWPIRTWHVHTQHPLELTHVLNGWGPQGPDDLAGWQALLPEWERFLEWAVANRQNRVAWFLLMAQSWQTFADSPERQARLATLVDMAHQWGLAAGIDAPIAFKQQHAWTMLRQRGNETAQIQSAIDWLAAAGADFLEIEMGYSEFTHPSDTQMLGWMNEVADYAKTTYGKPVYVKVHCSQKQLAKHFNDPETGTALNFNFLPYYATPALGVMPHTVQHYDLEGPAYTYDNENFHYLRRYMQLEAGRREVLYYPETAYWVNFDIDVPLFLPLYAASRLNDLRLIDADERAGKMGRGEYAGARIQGQVNFSSGWEWGYWLNDVVTARAVWNPMADVHDDHAALALALQPFTSLLGNADADANRLLRQWIDQTRDLLWYGKPGAALDPDSAPRAVARNAQAYLQGWDTWSEVAKRLGSGETQPRNMGMLDMLNPLLPKSQRVPYQRELRPLLQSTAAQLRATYTDYAALAPNVAPAGRPLYNEIRDAMEITTLRAEQVYALYETVAHQSILVLNQDKTAANQALNQARKALDRATEVVAGREAHYRADPARIAAWDYNPTAYHYGYLWTVHSLYFWWRDEGKAVDRPLSPGYLNFKDPVDIANGEGVWKESIFNLTRMRDLLGRSPFWHEMLFEPENGPLIPQPGLRARPAWYQPLP